MRLHPLLAAALLLLPLVHAQERSTVEAPAPAQAAAHLAYGQRLATTLAQEGGARELALAALLVAAAEEDAGRSPQVEAWRRAAAAAAGTDVLANQLLVASAASDEDAIAREAARRWQAAEPDNLIPLLHAGLTIDALLAQAGGASRADAGLYPGVRWIASAWRRHPPQAAEQAAMTGGQPLDLEEAAAVTAMGLWAATAMPGYAPLVEACDQRMLRALPARRGDCRHVALLLADRSTSIADQAAGLAMLRALASSAAERDEVDARARRMDWRMLQWGRLARQQPRDGAGQFARLLADASVTSEQQLVDRVLAEGGVAPEPPADWTPPRR